MRNYKAKNVDDYIAHAKEEAQPLLKKLRAVINSTIPEADEGISWGIPYYKYYGPLAGFSPFKKHVSFGFATQLSHELKEKLNKKGYITGNKTIQINFDQPVPQKEIKEYLKAQAKVNESKKKI